MIDKTWHIFAVGTRNRPDLPGEASPEIGIPGQPGVQDLNGGQPAGPAVAADVYIPEPAVT
jgi:hypothetical protein